MNKLKPIDCRILFELVKDSRKSDRQIAKAIKTSQPTVTKRRKFLERTLVQEYTLIPRVDKLGFEILAFTFVKSALKRATLKARKEATLAGREWIMRQPNVIFASSGQGLGWDGLAISLHKDYSDYRAFVQKMKDEMSSAVQEIESFITLTNPERVVKLLSFRYLAESQVF